MICKKHGGTECPAQTELASLDDQIFKRMTAQSDAEKMRKSLSEQCEITARLVDANTRLRAALCALEQAATNNIEAWSPVLDAELDQARQVILETEIT